MKKFMKFVLGLAATTALVLGFLQFIPSTTHVGWNSSASVIQSQDTQLAFSVGRIVLPNVGWNS
jgi:hypothetical protein